MKKILSFFAAALFAGSVMAGSFVKVTDASTLAAGDEIIIVNVDGDKALSTTQNNNNRGAADVTLTDDTIVPGEAVQVIKLEAAEANFKLNVGEDAYLYATSNSSNHLKTANAETVGANGEFLITIEEGVAAFTAQGTNTRNSLRYNPNNGNPMFSCYASNTSVAAGLQIFKKVAGEEGSEGEGGEGEGGEGEGGEEESAEWKEIKFDSVVVADDLAEDAVFAVEDSTFKVTVTDPDNKMSIDANSCRFGDAEAYVSYSHRLKTGGKTTSNKNYMTFTISEDGFLRFAVRTGSNSDTLMLDYSSKEYNIYLGDGNDIVTIDEYNVINNLVCGEGGNDTYNLNFIRSTSFCSQNTIYDNSGNDSINFTNYAGIKSYLKMYVNVYANNSYDNNLIVYDDYNVIGT